MSSYDYLAGLEAIDFQIDNKLGRAIDNIYDEIFAYIATVDVSGASRKDRQALKAKALYDIKDQIEKQLHDAIYKACGMNFYAITVDCDPEKGPRFSFWSQIDINGSTTNIIHGKEGAISGIYRHHIEVPTNQLAMIEQINAFYDKHSGTLHKIDGKEIPIKPVLNIDLMCFIMDEYVNPELVRPMNSRELTAITLHEIGHCLNIVENLRQLHACGRIINTGINYGDLTKEQLAKEMEAVANTSAQMVAQLRQQKKSKFVNVAIEELQRCITAATNLNNEMQLHPDIPADKLVASATAISMSSTVNIMKSTVWRCLKKISANLKVPGKDRDKYDQLHAGMKTTDMRNNILNVTIIEHMADEFAVKQGYGDALVSGFAIMDKFCKLYFTNDLVRAMRTAEATGEKLGLIASTALWIHDFSLGWCLYPADCHEERFARMITVMHDIYGFFRADRKNLNPKYLELWIKRADAAKAALASMKVTKARNVGLACANIINALISSSIWSERLHDGRLDKDYAVLKKRMEQMTNNELHLLAAKFELAAR